MSVHHTKAEHADRGSASLWVVAGGTLVLLVALVAVLRGSAVLAREQAEVAADLAALAAADGIGIDGSSTEVCARATRIAIANQARLVGCAVRLGADGRTGTVDVAVSVRVRLVAVGAAVVHARARAVRLAWASAASLTAPGQVPAVSRSPAVGLRDAVRSSCIWPLAVRSSWIVALAVRSSCIWPLAVRSSWVWPLAVRSSAVLARGPPTRGPLIAWCAPAGPVRELWHDWSAAGLKPVCAQPGAWRG